MPLIDALIARLAVPLAATTVAVVLVRLAGGRVVGARTAALGLPVGFVAAYAVAPGWPWLPPTDPFDQLAWFALGGALLGLAVDLATRGRVAATMVALVWPALGIAWLGGGDVLNTEGSNLYRFGEVSLVLGLALARLHLISVDGLSGPITAAVIAAGMAVLGVLHGVPGVAAVSLPLAAVGLAWLGCNWPVRRFPLGAAGLLGASGATMVLAGHAALQTPVNASLVLLVLAGVLVQPAVPALAVRIPGLGSPGLRPLTTALLTAIPGVIAIALAWLAPDLLPSLY